MPLLKQRVVMITISDVGEGLLRVNVIPRKLEGSTDENGALTVPLSITGKAEELDRELPGQLASFTESVTQTGSNPVSYTHLVGSVWIPEVVTAHIKDLTVAVSTTATKNSFEILSNHARCGGSLSDESV